MQGRSRMAALTFTTSALLGLVLGFALPDASRADDTKPTTPPPPAPAPAPTTAPGATVAPSKVMLNLGIAGLGPKGCDVEIAPGHMGCKFRPVSLHVSQRDATKLEILFEDVQTIGADRNCMFAITIREPGQPVKVVRRGLRLLAPSADPTSVQVLTCYLSSPSKLARGSEMRERR